MIGKLLDHRYQVIRVLATGGFGETYIAQDTKRPGNPICVVKHLKPISTDSSLFDTAKRLFHSEAETLEKLGHHDQIPRLLAYFDENQEFYLVQEFIEGHPLSDELNPDEIWTEGEVLDLLIEVLNILEFVHTQGVIHRDIKPDNIIRRASDNKLVLVDFGAVKKLRTAEAGYHQISPSEYATQMSMLNAGGQLSATVAIGTPGYMPTEQAQGKPRPNSDIYALGIIAIQALTGVPPMEMQEDPQTGEILWQHLVPINQDLAAVLSKMVCYYFKDRYQSVRETLQALQPLAIRSETVEYPRISDYQPIKSRSPHSRQKTIAVAPANPASPSLPQPQPKPVAVHKSSTGPGPDLLQLSILVVLAGSAAAVAPVVVKNVQNFTANITGGQDITSTQTCLAVVKANKANIRSQPSAIARETIMQTVSKNTKLEVTGKRTKRGWVEVKIHSGRSAWIYSDAIKNNDEWVACLRDKGIAVKTVDDLNLIGTRPNPKSKSLVNVETLSPETLEPSPSLFPKSESKKSQVKTTTQSTAQVLEQARNKYESGDLQNAIELVKSIPGNASGFKETAEMITQWQQDWAKSEALFNDINNALDNGKWDKVLAYKDHPEKLPNIQYWRNKIEPLFQQAAENLAKQSLPQTTNTSKDFKDKLTNPDSTLNSH